MILAGDIGGTSTRLAAFEIHDSRLVTIAEEVFPSRKFNGLEEIAAAFVVPRNLKIDRACFGIAGPVQNGSVKTPNLAWTVETAQLARTLGLPTVSLINDLEANAYGVAALDPSEFVVLSEGVAGAVGNIAIISAGTGLGEAGLYWDGKQHQPFACEGGHTDFAPRTEIETELFTWLRAKFGHVSYERVLSGPGLLNIYQFLCDTGKGKPSAEVASEMARRDPSAAISRAALAGTDPLCIQALDLFVGFYGAEAGNLALKIMSRGGVYVGGGIAPKILEKIKGTIFIEAFLDKGRMRPLLEAMPVRVIMNEKTALLGAARCAAMKTE
jgi:glucokinase